jgi:PKD repeat protein
MKIAARKTFFLILLLTLTLIASVVYANIWPTFQHDNKHTGRSNSLGPESNEINWTYELATAGSYRVTSSQPIIGPTGVIYFGLGELGANKWGKLYAINPNGMLRWEISFPTPPQTPAIGPDNTIYVPTYSNGIYALNPDGTEKWRFFIEGMDGISAITVGDDGVIYFPVYVSTDRTYRLYSLNPNGSEKWVVLGPRGGLQPPAIGIDGTIYMVWQGFQNLTDEQRGILRAYNPDGTAKWSKPLEFAASAPAIGPEGNIYVVAGVNTYFGTLRYLITFAPDGTKLWNSTQWEYGSLFTPVITAEANIIIADRWSVVCGESSGTYVWCPWSQIRIYNPQGEILNTIGPSEFLKVETQPIIDREGNIFIGRTIYQRTGVLPTPVKWKLDSIDSSGTVNWSFETSLNSNLISPTIGKHGSLYVVRGESQGIADTYKFILYAFQPTEENQTPTASFNWTPEEPDANEEINFDASGSDDPDGEILAYNWDFDDGSTAQGKIVKHTYENIGDYSVTMTVTDDENASDTESKTISVSAKKWSFAIITDLHIGWGIPDYADEGYSFSDEAVQDYYINPTLKEPGQDYYLTKRLKQTIQWINDNYKKPDYNIKFVIVDGDVSDTAEYSEFLTTRKILDELKIPYIPIIGNHDIWPYTQKINCGPDGGKLGRITSIQERVQDKTVESLGDEYFETVFWSPNNPNVQRINNLFSDFERQEEKEGYQGAPYFQNYSFTYKEMNFIALDFAPRDFSKLISSPLADLWKEITLKWFEEKLNNHVREKVIVFTHYPFKIPFEFDPRDPSAGFWWLDRKEISNTIRNCNCEVLNFAGHTHINEIGSPGDEYKVIEIEPTSQIPVNPSYDLTGEFIGLVQISRDNIEEISYNTPIGGFPSAINPYFTVNPAEISVGQKITFRSYTKNLEPKDILSYNWDFDKNYDAQCVREEEKSSQCSVTYNQPGTYKVTLKVIPKNDPNYSEELYWNIKVNQAVKTPYKIILQIPGIFPLLNGEEDMDLTQQANAQNTKESVLITKITSPAKPIGVLNIHFEEATDDVNLSNLVADVDLDIKKSILYMPWWSNLVENEKILFIPFLKE